MRVFLPPLLAATALVGCSSTPARRNAWNVLLVSVDTLRADHLSSYGATALRTEAMDRLASEGVLFENVTTVAPTTLPAHASLFTARTPPRHGVRDNVGFYLNAEIPTLAARLKDEGYETAGFVGAFVLDSRFGIARGFDFWDDELGGAAGEQAQGGVAQRRGEEVLASALRWLEGLEGFEGLDGRSSDTRPFFAFVHFYDPHAPYDGPGNDDRARYRSEVDYVDSLVGRLLDWLHDRGLEERTLVVLTSDHGESLGEHGELTHGFFVYQSTLRVPLLLRYPGAPRGTRVGGLARLIDVAPTVLDLLGLPALPEGDGESLVPRIQGEPPPEPAAYAETFVPRLHYGWSELHAFRRGRYKLVLAPLPELFDLESDPGESRNLFRERLDVARSLESELRRLVDDEVPEAAEVDDESRRKLEALGYVARPGGIPGEETLADPKERLELYLLLNDPTLESLDAADEEFSQVLEGLARVVQEEPNVPRAYVLYGDLLLKAGRAREAETIFEKLVGLASGDPFPGQYGLGVARAHQGNWSGAISAFERALALEPLNTKTHFQLAELEQTRGNVDGAERWLRQAIAIAPDRILAERLASLLVSAGRNSEALALWTARAESAPNDPLAHYRLGQFFFSEGNLSEAVRALRRAVELEGESAELHQALGAALLSSGDRDGAIAAFEKAVALSPCFSQALSNLGSAYAESGRTSEAIGLYQKAVSCDPGYTLGYRNLAAVYLESGDVRAAIESLQKAVAAGAADSELRKTLAELVAYERARR